MSKEEIDLTIQMCKDYPHLFNSVVKNANKCNDDILVFKPKRNTDLNCLECGNILIHKDEKFANGVDKSKLPRQIYGIYKNCQLVSAVYRCTPCQHDFLGHHQDILSQSSEDQNFLLYNQSGVTKELFNWLITTISQGKGLERVIYFQGTY